MAMKKLFLALMCLVLVFAFASCDLINSLFKPDGECEHRDANDDSLCDNCGEEFSDGKDVEDKPECAHRDVNDDNLCDKCGESYSDGVDIPDADDPTCTHRDSDDDNLCDKCGESYSDGKDIPDVDDPTCTHRDADDDNLCDKCGESYSDGVDIPVEPECDHRDADDDNLCDKCGRSYSDGKDIHDEPECDHRDADDDNLCDKCGESFDDGKDGDNEYPTEGTAGLIYSVSDDKTYASIVGYDGEATDVIIPQTYYSLPVKSIGDLAFCYCASITSVMIPDSVTSIGEDTFFCCSNLENIYIDNGNKCYKSIDGSIYSKDGKTLVQYAVGKRESSFALPDKVTSIGPNAFSSCQNLTSINIGADLSDVGAYAFYACLSLTEIIVDENNEHYKSVDGNMYSKDGKTLVQYALGKQDDLFSIPSGVVKIADHAFEYCSKPNSLIIPNSVTNIGKAAFSMCGKLTVYYTDIEDEWNEIVIGDYNESLASAARYYYSENRPLEEGNFWHYVDGVVTVWPKCDHRDADDDDLCDECGISYSDGKDIPDVPGEGLEYAINPDNASYSVITIGTCDDTNLIIPSTYEGLPVTGIGNSAFYGCTNLSSVTIPDSVKNIDTAAFYGCSGLLSVTIPDSVTSIGEGAFYECSSLSCVTIPDSVTTIGIFTFAYCDNLTAITITNSVTNILDYAFAYCYSLTSVTIPDSVTSIGEGAFYECYNLTNINIPDSVTSIGERAFLECYNLTNINIPDSVTSIGDYAFTYCTSLISISVDENNEYYKSIEGNLYSKDGKTLIQYAIAKNDTEFSLPEGVTSICEFAFAYSEYLESILIPDSVASIGKGALYACYNLTNIEVAEGNEYFASSDGDLYSKDGKTLIQYAMGKNDAKFTINNGVISIGDYAFANCYSLTRIIIPDSVTSIGNYAFAYCYNLTNINIPDSVTSIGDFALACCESLTSITIPDSVTSIGDYAFGGCSNLANVTIPSGVTSIGDYTFAYCESLTNITIPDGVTSIGDFAFTDCYGLTSIIIPDSVTSIGDGAFAYCHSLTSVTIPNSVTSIGNYAFVLCESLKSVTIPNSVTSIGDYAFGGCSNLVTLYYAGSSKDWDNTSIGSDNENLTDVTRYYYSESKPIDEGNFWHYVDGVITVWPKCDHRDANDDDLCDKCGVSYSDGVDIPVEPECDHRDADDDNLCDKCGESYSDGVDIPVEPECDHRDSDDDNLCDKCGESYSDGKDIPDETVYLNGLVFTLNPDKASYSVTDVDNCQDTNLVIPGTCEGLPVTSIGDQAFAYCDIITSVTIPDSVTRIENSAFAICENLASVTIPDSVTYIGECAFGECKNLLSIKIPNGVTSINYGAFAECINLTDVTIPNSVTSIDVYAFDHCTGLVGLTIPDSVTEIGSFAFSYCTSLASIIIPDSVTSIGDRAFSYCTNLASVSISKSVTSIPYLTFAYCESLTDVTIPDGVATVTAAFYGCKNLSSVIIPLSVTSISVSSFYECDNLATVYYCGTVYDWNEISIASGNECLITAARYYYSESMPTYSGRFWHYVDGVVTVWTEYREPECDHRDANDDNLCDKCGESFSDGKDVEDGPTEGIIYSTSTDGTYLIVSGYEGEGVNIIIPDSNDGLPVKEIGDYAFEECYTIVSVRIPDSVTDIGEGAFSYCVALIDIEVDENNAYYASIDGNLYSKDGKVLIKYALGKSDTTFTVPDSVNTIYSEAFTGNANLTSIKIPATVTEIGDFALAGISTLEYIDIDTDNEYYASIDGNLYTKDEKSLILYATGKKDGAFTIPDGVTEICDFAFAYCENLLSVVIPDSVLSINDSAFFCCFALGEVSIGSGVTYIGINAFHGCISITEIVIPYGVKRIQYGVFAECTSLASITIPDSVTSIGELAFFLCSSLTSIEIPDSVEEIEYAAFERCMNLTHITIGSGLNAIGESVFMYCAALESITVSADNAYFSSIDGNLYSKDGNVLIQYAIGKQDGLFILPDSVITIGERAFFLCTNLSEIVIGQNVTSIGSSAFGWCTYLYVYYEGTADDWDKISIAGYNDELDDIYFYSESPTYSDDCWHYDENGNIAFW